jgi:hypothetical protein
MLNSTKGGEVHIGSGCAGITMKGETNEQVVRHLFEAIDRVREDVAKVEFWASAVTGFAEPVPGYEPDSTRVWFPTEQATSLKRRKSHTQ